MDLDRISNCTSGKLQICEKLEAVERGDLDEECLGLLDAVKRLNEINRRLRNLIAPDCPASHPTVPQLDGLAYVMFHSTDPDGVLRTCTTLRPGRADRSPCGTGSNANMAARHAAGTVRPGDRIVSRSIIGGEFVTEFMEETTVGDLPATRNRISGQCWIYAMTQIGLDPTDPFPNGFTLSDTWGG